MEDLKVLEQGVRDAKKIYEELRDKALKLRRSIALPEMKKKYEGKYFKYPNSYGDSDNGWWLYSYCQEIVDVDTIKGFAFETDCNGKITIHPSSYMHEHLFHKKITKKEYERNLDKVFLSINTRSVAW